MITNIVIIATVFVIIPASIIVTVIFWFRTALYENYTLKGLEMRKYLEGLKLYIKMAEEERIKFLQSVEGADTSPEGVVRLYEKLLPYACLFGLEESWMEELGRYYQTENVTDPTWYSGVDIMDAATFTSVSHDISSAVASSDSSSSSGGGDDGSSGDGGGGGGGGGW